MCGRRDVEGGCQDCDDAADLVRCYGADQLALVVDGSWKDGYAGAGLVLVLGDPAHPSSEILASKECSFLTDQGHDAEFQAVIRGARWAPGVVIWTDEQCLPSKVMRGSPNLDVRYMPPNVRNKKRSEALGGGFGVPAHRLAHTISVRGRCRDNPAADPRTVEYAKRKQDLSMRQRKMLGAEILLETAASDPAFDGDFFALAERLGWTSGKLWRHNPNIHVAAKRWLAMCVDRGAKISKSGG